LKKRKKDFYCSIWIQPIFQDIINDIIKKFKEETKIKEFKDFKNLNEQSKIEYFKKFFCYNGLTLEIIKYYFYLCIFIQTKIAKDLSEKNKSLNDKINMFYKVMSLSQSFWLDSLSIKNIILEKFKIFDLTKYNFNNLKHLENIFNNLKDLNNNTQKEIKKNLKFENNQINFPRIFLDEANNTKNNFHGKFFHANEEKNLFSENNNINLNFFKIFLKNEFFYENNNLEDDYKKYHEIRTNIGYHIITAVEEIKIFNDSKISLCVGTEFSFWNNTLISELIQYKITSREIKIFILQFQDNSLPKDIFNNFFDIYFSSEIKDEFKKNFSKFYEIDSIGIIFNFMINLFDKLIKNENSNINKIISDSINTSLSSQKNKIIFYINNNYSFDYITVTTIIYFISKLSLLYGGVFKKVKNHNDTNKSIEDVNIENEDINKIPECSYLMGFLRKYKFKNFEKLIYSVPINERYYCIEYFSKIERIKSLKKYLYDCNDPEDEIYENLVKIF
jgi:hypothetical protein